MARSPDGSATADLHLEHAALVASGPSVVRPLVLFSAVTRCAPAARTAFCFLVAAEVEELLNVVFGLAAHALLEVLAPDLVPRPPVHVRVLEIGRASCR